jgi:hypothetical protein
MMTRREYSDADLETDVLAKLQHGPLGFSDLTHHLGVERFSRQLERALARMKRRGLVHSRKTGEGAFGDSKWFLGGAR